MKNLVYVAILSQDVPTSIDFNYLEQAYIHPWGGSQGQQTRLGYDSFLFAWPIWRLQYTLSFLTLTL